MKKLLIILSAFVFASCADNKNAELIKGEWKGAEWLVNGEAGARDAASASFSFDDKGNYRFNYQTIRESGTYKVENDMLFTRPAGEKEMMVKIAKLTSDSLVFDMSRGGTPETLTLLRSK